MEMPRCFSSSIQSEVVARWFLRSGDGAGEMDGVAVEQEFLRERGLARIGVRDDREGATAGDFLAAAERDLRCRRPCRSPD
jgi:hypothetical protein